MSPARFLQFHTLTSYPASLLNRDDAGFAKRMPFGGASRVRISSQCLKRHWRTFEGEGGLSTIEGVNASVRSRLTFDELILKPLVASGVKEPIARSIVEQIMAVVLGESIKKKKKKAKEEEEEVMTERLQTSQLTVLGRPEVAYLLDAAKTLASKVDGDEKAIKDACKQFFGKEQKKNMQALKRGAGLDAALFGRMVTSDILTRQDAAMHVAHAMTVHGEQSEPDYFTAVDDLLGMDSDDGELGSAHLGTTELTSGLFYSYVSIDIPQLVSNLEGIKQADWQSGDLTLAKAIVSRLPHILATVSPGAKKGSTAPFAYAHMLLVEAGSAQPRTLANAFLKPVSTNGDVVANTYAAIDVHVADLDAMYGSSFERMGAALGDRSRLSSFSAEWGSIAQVGEWASSKLGS